MYSAKLLSLFNCDYSVQSIEFQREIFIIFFNCVYPRVYSYVKDCFIAEDIVQEAFMRVLERRPQYIDQRFIVGWVRKIATNIARNHIRKNRRISFCEYDPELYEKNKITFAASAESQYFEEYNLLLVTEFIGGLRHDYKLIISLHLEGNSYKKISEQLNITEGAVRQKLYRLRESIRMKLAKELELENKESIRKNEP